MSCLPALAFATQTCHAQKYYLSYFLCTSPHIKYTKKIQSSILVLFFFFPLKADCFSYPHLSLIVMLNIIVDQATDSSGQKINFVKLEKIGFFGVGRAPIQPAQQNGERSSEIHCCRSLLFSYHIPFLLTWFHTIYKLIQAISRYTYPELYNTYSQTHRSDVYLPLINSPLSV